MNKSIITISKLHISYNNNEILKNINLKRRRFYLTYWRNRKWKKFIIKITIQMVDFQIGNIDYDILICQRLKIEKLLP